MQIEAGNVDVTAWSVGFGWRISVLESQKWTGIEKKLAQVVFII